MSNYGSTGQGRTGFKQASRALRRHGLRPARYERLMPSVQRHIGGSRFAAVPLQRGMTDTNVLIEDVVAHAPTLTDLVRLVEEGAAKKSGEQQKGVQEGETFQQAAERAWEQATVETSSTTTTDSTEAKTVEAEDAGVLVFSDAEELKRKAIEILLGNSGASVDPNKVRQIVLETLQERFASDARGYLETAGKSIQEELNRAIESIKNHITLPVVIRQQGKEDVKVEGQHREFSRLVKLLGMGQNVYAVGPAGSGKTTAMINAANALGRNAYLVSSIQDPFEATGYLSPQLGGEPLFVETAVYRWAKDKGALLILDEIDRANPQALCSLHSMIENGKANFACGEVPIDPSNMVCATANTYGIGPDAEYVGSNRLDAATLNRFPVRLTIDYDESLETRIALAHGGESSEIGFGQRLRRAIRQRGLRVVWSPRDVVAHAVRVANGISRNESIALSCLSSLDATTREQLCAEAV